MSIYSDYWRKSGSIVTQQTEYISEREQLLNNYFFYDKQNAWYKVQAANLSDAIGQVPEDYDYVRYDVNLATKPWRNGRNY